MKKTDVLIIGGGPAGSSAALPLISAGFSVVILEKKKVIGVPNHCGEGISELCLREAGFTDQEPWIVQRVKGARIIFPNRTTVNFTQKGYSIQRPEFDQALSERVQEKGAEIHLNTKVTSIIQEKDAWLVETSDGEKYRSKYMVGAGGAKCPLAAHFKQKPFLLPAFQYKFSEENVSDKMDPTWLDFYHDASFPGGYGWVFPRKNEISIGAGSNQDLKQNLDLLCKKLGYSPENAIKTEGGPIPFLKKPLCVTFPRALLVGDSGGFTYPLTKGGVHGAIWSGKIAGKLIGEALQTGNPTTIQKYDSLVKKHPARRKRHLRMPQTFFTFNNEMFNGIGRIMDGREFSDLAVGPLFKEFTKPSRDLLKGVLIGGVIQYQFRKTRRFAW